MKRVTCREIGEKLGLSHSTVSLALRDHPSLPKVTKEKVRKMAEALGYRPDPALGALNAYRQASRGYKFQSTLAWINPYPEAEGQDMPEWMLPAARRAEELGFRLEPVWVPQREDWQRLPRILKSRGIQGFVRTPWLLRKPDSLLNLQEPDAWPWRDFPWHDFSAISMGQSLPPLHHEVIHHQFQGAALAVLELFALGYRKIGIVLHAPAWERPAHSWLGGYLAECQRLGLSPRYLLDRNIGPAANPADNRRFQERTAQWILRHRPDAVIASGDGDILPALRLAKLRFPEEIAVAVLCVMKGHPELAAIDQNYELTGQVTINQLVDMIRRNERGIPSSPMYYHIRGRWQPGPSAPPAGG